MTTETRMRETIRQMMTDWDFATAENREAAMADASALAGAREAALVSGQLTDIARKFAGVSTLEERNSDRLDFSEIHVTSLRSALLAAFEAGKLA